jgi:hypothetical protein
MPMMYMDDAIAATIKIMQAPIEQIKIRSSYNLAAMSFNGDCRRNHQAYSEFTITYEPDFRQK